MTPMWIDNKIESTPQLKKFVQDINKSYNDVLKSLEEVKNHLDKMTPEDGEKAEEKMFNVYGALRGFDGKIALLNDYFANEDTHEEI